jgi:hypothetical protein
MGRHRYAGIFIVVMFMFLCAMQPGEAVQIISGGTNPSVAAGKVVDDDLIIFGGKDVIIDGTVNGESISSGMKKGPQALYGPYSHLSAGLSYGQYGNGFCQIHGLPGKEISLKILAKVL